LSAQVADGQVRIAVLDNGSGIEAALLPHVFELFTQGTRTLDRAQGGLGLGLALVKSMVALHGGTVHAHSDGPGRGSMFTLALPLLEQAAAPAPPDGGATMRAARRALSVMIVDDNADSVVTLGALLQAAGHRVATLTDPLMAQAAAAECRPEVCILDIGMPGMDGYQLVRRLRADPASSAALCVALSGYGQRDDRQAAFDAGFDRHFAKPVDIRQLLALLDEHAAD
jgi:CheY-like chemotaxis protein